ncbi:DUF192 domain-containing protein [Gammaproteobacteria bacterium]|nr:DUF192 domain-containing protein [Gammaproteobacteria bacterium]
MSVIASQLLLFFDISLSQLPSSKIHTSIQHVFLNQKVMNIHHMQGTYDRYFGLMGVHQWPINHALLFDDQSRSFWMRNVPIGLDLVFFDKNQCVLDFKRAIPYSHSQIKAPPEARFTLELGSGAVEYYRIKKGGCLTK